MSNIGSRRIDVDVLVLGAGPAGAIAARVLAGAGASVVLADRSNYENFRIGETLPPIANQILAKLGMPSLLAESVHMPSPGTIAAWGSEHPHDNDFIFSTGGYGWHVDRRRFDRSLAHAAAASGATFIVQARPDICERGRRNRWHVSLSTIRERIFVTSRWIIDATGRASWFVRSQKVGRRTHDRLMAIIGILDDPEQNDPRTLVEAMPTGWWYVSPLPGRRAVAAFFTDSDIHNLGMRNAGSLWQAYLRSSVLVRNRLSGASVASFPRVVSCATITSNRVADDGWLAVGDAAAAIDPLSSQGICWAISTAVDAANVVLAAESGSALVRYQSEWDYRLQEFFMLRQLYYSAEHRWPNARFWKRRSDSSVAGFSKFDGP